MSNKHVSLLTFKLLFLGIGTPVTYYAYDTSFFITNMAITIVIFIQAVYYLYAVITILS